MNICNRLSPKNTEIFLHCLCGKVGVQHIFGYSQSSVVSYFFLSRLILYNTLRNFKTDLALICPITTRSIMHTNKIISKKLEQWLFTYTKHLTLICLYKIFSVYFLKKATVLKNIMNSCFLFCIARHDVFYIQG